MVRRVTSNTDAAKPNTRGITFFRAQENGRPFALCECSQCGVIESFPCQNEGQARERLIHLRWLVRGRKITCPGCHSQEKPNVNQPLSLVAAAPSVEPPPAPSRQQRREIMDMLREVYDIDAERYKGNETDNTVADILGLRIGWVTEIREEFFGPLGSNTEMQELRDLLEAINSRSAELETRVNAMVSDLVNLRREGTEANNRLAKVMSAVGERALKKANINS